MSPISHLIALFRPKYATRTFAGLGVACMLIGTVQQAAGAKVSTKDAHKHMVVEFRWFQATYLAVYLLTILADWLQGTTM